MNLNKSIVIFIFVAMCGCGKKDLSQDTPIVKRKAIDMSEAAVNKRWFERRFKTSYIDLVKIEGGCLSWGMSGQCHYIFETLESVNVEPKNSYDVISCEVIYKRLYEEFNENENLDDIDKLVCRKDVQNINDVYWINVKSTSKNFVWEQYESTKS